MIWKEYLNTISKELAEYLKKDIQHSNIPEIGIRQIAWREIEIFLEEKIKLSPERLIIIEKNPISRKNQKLLREFIEKRKKEIPLAYILGKYKFFGLDFKVNKNTLIPRPETEELVSLALKKIKSQKKIGLIDVGTGSGCILIAILKNISNKKLAGIYAIDKNKKTLKIAKGNCKTHFNSTAKVKFIHGSLLDSLNLKQTDQKFIIIANLPYLSEKEYQKLSLEVRNHEPKTALVGGKNGHELICKLINQSRLKFNKFEIFLEISPIILPKIKKYLGKQDIFFETKRDLSGKTRFLHISNN